MPTAALNSGFSGVLFSGPVCSGWLAAGVGVVMVVVSSGILGGVVLCICRMRVFILLQPCCLALGRGLYYAFGVAGCCFVFVIWFYLILFWILPMR